VAKLSSLDVEMNIEVFRAVGGYHDLIHPTLEGHSVADALVYHHEVIHDEMFRTSKFGLVQLVFKALSEQTTDASLRRNAISVGTALFGCSVTTHEAAATYLSVKSLPVALQARMAASYPVQYKDYYTRLASIVDPVFSSSRAQSILGRVVCLLALGGSIIRTASEWDGSAKLHIDDEQVPNELMDRIARQRPFTREAIQEQFRLRTLGTDLHNVLDSDIDDWEAWKKVGMKQIDRVDSILYEACMQVAATEKLGELMRWQEDGADAIKLYERIRKFCPEFLTPAHYIYNGSLRDELSSRNRAQANARFVSEFSFDKTKLEGLIDLPIMIEKGRAPAVLISENRASGSGMWCFFQFPLDGSVDGKRVSEKSVLRFFDIRRRMGQIGMPISSNIIFVTGGMAEIYKSDVTKVNLLSDLHKLIGNPKASFSLKNCFVYMSGDILQWLLSISKTSAPTSIIIIPDELREAMGVPPVCETLDEQEDLDARLIDAISQAEVKTFMIMLSTEYGSTFFRMFPIHSLGVVCLLVEIFIQSGKLKPRDYTIEKLASESWDILSSVVQNVWSEL